MADIAQKLQLISVMALPFLLAVTWREAARGYIAHKLGDPTPRLNGRLKVNPLAHFDPVNTAVLPVVAMLIGVPFLIGSGKVMPIEVRYFSGGKSDLIKLAATGIVTNFLIAVFFAYVMRFAMVYGLTTESWVTLTAYYGILLNSVFMVLHLLPVPPLDGGQIVAALLPDSLAETYEQIAPFGFFIILGIFFLAPQIIVVPMEVITALIIALVGVPV